MSLPTILLTAGTGNVGAALVSLLAKDDRIGQVRIGTRHPRGQAAHLLAAYAPGKVIPVAFDPADGHGMRNALSGVDRLVLIVPLVEDMTAWQRKILDAAPNTLGQVVKLSMDGAASAQQGDDSNPLGVAHWAGERMIRELGVRHFIIRPTIYMQHFGMVPGLYTAGDDRVYLPTGEGRVAFADVRDIAYALYRALREPALSDELENGTMAFSGPEALTGAEVAERIGYAAGREVEWVDGEEAFVKHSEAVGSPAEVKEVYAAGRQGFFSAVHTEDYVRIAGRQPTTFAEFAYDQRELWAPR